MEHIERHLDRQIEVAGPARIAMTSEHRFRRMFSALAGSRCRNTYGAGG